METIAKSMAGILALLSILFFSSFSLAQKDASNWYFGNQAGIHFGPGPVALTNGQMTADEGCSSISDTNGVLLFYSNGINVWNRNHQVMSNGSGLLGDQSSTTSCHIVPQPGTQYYYVFTTDAVENNLANGFRYSIVDMSLNGGLGDVISINNMLLQSSCEKITSVYHRNGTDIWVLAHGFGNNSFYAYLMSASGLNITPVQSDVGSKLSQVSTGTGSNNFSAVGYMKCSHDGTKLANALFGFLNRTELFDFDNSTGKLSNTRSIAGPHFSQGFLFAFGGAYGLEFSANDSLLYVSTVYEDPFLLQASGWIYQYQISSGNQTTINSSASLIIQASGIAWGAMQLAPDCRIYISDGAITGSAASLDVIQNPDVPGSGCGYQHNAFNLNGKTSGFGLPQFLSPCRKVNFSFLSACPGDTVKFTDKSTPPLTACSWNFGDPLSGIFNSSSLKNPTHIYANPGTYLVKLVVSGHGYKDSVEKQVTISKPQVELGNDTTLCPGSSITLNAGNPGASYEWWYKASPTSSATVLSSGTAAQTITKNSPGLYWAKVTINNCMQSDTILIDNFPALLDSLGNDTTLCAGQSLVIHAGNKPGASYVWSTGSMGEFIVADSSATYSVSISKNGCTSLFDKHIDFVNPVSIDIGKDSTLCSGQTITLSTNLSHASFLWSTGSVSNSITVGDSGTYWVEAHYYTCPKVSDTIVLYYIPGIEYVIPNLISPNGDGLNDEFRILNLIPNTTVHIDNRWGSEVYKSKNYRNDWNGDKLSAGVYYYFIGNDNSCVRDYKGWLYIEK